jgi:hypothetical protein
MLIKHVRDDFRCPFATIACDCVDGRILVGVSLCNTSDTFNKKFGRRVAITRMHNQKGVGLPNRRIVYGGEYRYIKPVLIDEVTAMVHRARKYFKPKELIS